MGKIGRLIQKGKERTNDNRYINLAEQLPFLFYFKFFLLSPISKNNSYCLCNSCVILSLEYSTYKTVLNHRFKMNLYTFSFVPSIV